MNFKFLKNKLARLYIGIASFLIGTFMVLAACDNPFVEKTVHVISFPFEKISSAFEYINVFFREKAELQDEITDLEAQNKKLQETAEMYEKLKLEIERAAKLDEMQNKYKDSKIVLGEIKSYDFLKNTYTAEFPMNEKNIDEVHIGDAVVTEKGMIGKVSSINDGSIQILTLNALDLKIGVYDESSGDIGVLCGSDTYKNENKCLLTLIPAKNNIKVGDVVSTSGMSGLFPKNLRIGTVDFAGFDNKTASYFAIIKLVENLLNSNEELKNVYVITDFPEKGK